MAIVFPSLKQFQSEWRYFVAQNRELPSQEIAWAFWQQLCQQGGLPSDRVGACYETIAGAEKGQGLFYTPHFLAAYLVERSLGMALQQQLAKIKERLACGDIDQVQVILEGVKSWRVVDPACGCGIFLLKALQAFHHFYQTLRALLPLSLAGALPEQGAGYALSYQLYGVDIDPLAVSLCEWSLRQEVKALIGEAWDGVDTASNLAVGNALSLPGTRCPEALQSRLQAKQRQQMQEGLKSSSLLSKPVPMHSWEEAFPEVEAWDFVLGNPPYITEVRQQSQSFQLLRHNSRISPYYQAKMDLADAFVLLSLELLKTSGQLAFVLPAYWLHRAGSRTLRERLWTQGCIREFWTFPEVAVFPRASGHHTSLLLFQAEKAAAHNAKNFQETFWGQGASSCQSMGLQADMLKPATLFLSSRSGKISYGETSEMEVLMTLSALPHRLLQPSDVQQGMVLPQDKLNNKAWQGLMPEIQAQVQPGGGIFVLNSQEVTALELSPAEQACMKPYYVPHPFEAFTGFGERSPDWVIYGDQETKQRFLQKPSVYVKLRKHLDRFASINTSAHGPYGLHRARQSHWFEDSRKILGLRQTDFPCFAMVPQAAYVNESFYLLCPPETPYLREEIVIILNSSLAWFWFSKQKHKGKRLQIDKDVLLDFPAPPKPEISRAPVPTEHLRNLDAWVYTLYGLHKAHIRLIEQLRWGADFDRKWLSLEPLLYAGESGNHA